MPLTSKQIMRFLEDAAMFEQQGRAQKASVVIRRMLVESLSPMAKSVYANLLGSGWMTSMELAKRLKVSVRSMDNRLKELKELGLAVNRDESNEHGKYYLWRVPL